jgi:hypothetical protein
VAAASAAPTDVSAASILAEAAASSIPTDAIAAESSVPTLASSATAVVAVSASISAAPVFTAGTKPPPGGLIPGAAIQKSIGQEVSAALSAFSGFIPKPTATAGSVKHHHGFEPLVEGLLAFFDPKAVESEGLRFVSELATALPSGLRFPTAIPTAFPSGFGLHPLKGGATVGATVAVSAAVDAPIPTGST